ncbi:hypothetical protein [Engelhardtia mirabilis]|uniref:Bacterial type II and III secretion system protein n=1 Tax=Engelhardtia mirabilis TaxID=2528011 RepID=A0A518BSE5_9BACT|nr:hypothetical protein Pla133_50080 [Planctomycetes bacterium Pla133]QDV04211.1 hypothetical protein Pla86_50060 [Planctomycetes bacterium Pla86]
MKNLLRTLGLLALAAPTALAAPSQDGDELGIAVFDLTGLLRRVDAGVYDIDILDQHGKLEDASGAGGSIGSEEVSIGALQEILVRLHEEQLRYRDAEQRSPMITTNGERQLVVRGTQALRDSVAATLGELDALLSQSAKVRVRWYKTSDGSYDQLPLGATIGTAELARLLEESQSSLDEEVTISLRLGSTGSVDLRTGQSAIVDYDVEIASNVSIVDPTVIQQLTGSQVVARFVPGVDGGYLSIVTTRTDAIGPVREEQMQVGTITASTGGNGENLRQVNVLPLSVQHQDTLTRALGLCTHVPAGRALLARTRWDLAGTSGDELMVVEVESAPLELTQTLESGGGTLSMVLRDALSRPRLSLVSDDYASMLVSERQLWGHGLVAELIADGSEVDFDLLPDAGRGWEQIGPWMAAMPGRGMDAAATRSAAHSLARGIAASTRSVAVARMGDRLVASFDVPVTDGARSFAIVALSTPLVSDIDVEVATGAGVSDPVVTETEEGLAIYFDPSLGRDGSWNLSPEAEVSVRTAGPRRIQMGETPGGWVDLLSTSRLGCSSEVRLESGEARVIGSPEGLSLALGLR